MSATMNRERGCIGAVLTSGEDPEEGDGLVIALHCVLRLLGQEILSEQVNSCRVDQKTRGAKRQVSILGSTWWGAQVTYMALKTPTMIRPKALLGS